MGNEILVAEMMQQLEQFKTNLKTAAKEVIDTLYVDMLAYIESDAAENFKNEIIRGLKDYNNARNIYKYDYKEIRHIIYLDHKKDIIADLNQELILKSEYWKSEYEDLLKEYNKLQETC